MDFRKIAELFGTMCQWCGTFRRRDMEKVKTFLQIVAAILTIGMVLARVLGLL